MLSATAPEETAAPASSANAEPTNQDSSASQPADTQPDSANTNGTTATDQNNSHPTPNGEQTPESQSPEVAQETTTSNSDGSSAISTANQDSGASETTTSSANDPPQDKSSASQDQLAENTATDVPSSPEPVGQASPEEHTANSSADAENVVGNESQSQTEVSNVNSPDAASTQVGEPEVVHPTESEVVMEENSEVGLSTDESASNDIGTDPVSNENGNDTAPTTSETAATEGENPSAENTRLVAEAKRSFAAGQTEAAKALENNSALPTTDSSFAQEPNETRVPLNEEEIAVIAQSKEDSLEKQFSTQQQTAATDESETAVAQAEPVAEQPVTTDGQSADPEQIPAPENVESATVEDRVANAASEVNAEVYGSEWTEERQAEITRALFGDQQYDESSAEYQSVYEAVGRGFQQSGPQFEVADEQNFGDKEFRSNFEEPLSEEPSSEISSVAS
jgi:hypothetical protein